MDIRGMLYDVGRDQGGKEAFYEQMIQRLADYGYNMLVLNLEYRFKFPSHPEVAMPDSLTPETVRRLDVYAKERGIELVPFMNCAGHCNGIGLTEKYNTLCADDSNSTKAVEQLRINLPEAEALMLDLYEDLYVSFSSKYFHIGGDEIRHLDVLYPNLEPKERIREAIRYLNKMCAHVKAQGRIPMIWGDMLLKYPELIEQVDQEAIICDWNSFTAPYLKPVSNRKTLSCFKEQNKSTIFSNAVSSWIGNPMISDNTTQNIVFASREYQEIFGEDAKGILTNVWQIEYGGCFDVVWPWLYLQSRVNQGEQRDCRSMEFLKEYTTLEWGLAPEDDSLKQWYRLVDTEVSKAVLYEAFMDQSLRPVLEEMGNRPYKLFRWFFSSLFHTENILPLLHAERKKWLNGHLLEQIEGFYRQALSLAEGMSQHAVRRREEARHLLQYNHVLLTVLGLVKLEEQFEQCYHRAADCQFTNQSAFESYMKELASICGKIADGAQELADWVKVLYQEENYAADACVMPGRSVTELRKRGVFLKEIAMAGNPLVSYQRYICRPGDLPMVRHIGRDLSL